MSTIRDRPGRGCRPSALKIWMPQSQGITSCKKRDPFFLNSATFLHIFFQRLVILIPLKRFSTLWPEVHSSPNPWSSAWGSSANSEKLRWTYEETSASSPEVWWNRVENSKLLSIRMPQFFSRNTNTCTIQRLFCKIRKTLEHESFLAKIGLDTAADGPSDGPKKKERWNRRLKDLKLAMWLEFQNAGKVKPIKYDFSSIRFFGFHRSIPTHQRRKEHATS